MVKSAGLGKEIVVNVVNKIGVLADMSKVLAEGGINIEAVAGYATQNNAAQIMLVADDNLRAIDALKKAGYKSAGDREVIIIELENKTGALKNITAKLAAEGADIKYIYGTTCAENCPARIILSTTDNAKALAALKK